MSTLTAYLKEVREQFTKNLSSIKQLTIVTGNQSSDMDSCISAISYAFLSTKSDKATYDKSGPIMPLINIPKADLRLRRDIETALKGIDITADDLIFVDQLTALPKDLNLSLVLVDHNNPEGVYETKLVETFKPEIVGIIDHHADEGLAKNADPRVIQPCGSCSSLVLDHFRDVVVHKKLTLKDVQFLISAVLLDTGNMTNLVQAADEEVILAAEKYYPELDSKARKAYYKTLKAERVNIEGFSFRDLIRKDYKEYQCGNLVCGISSAKGPFSKLQSLYSAKTMEEELLKWKSERKLDVDTMMASFRDEQKVHRRQLLFVGEKELVDATVEALKEPLQLSPITTLDSMGPNISVFEQGNDSASRKGVAPLLTNFLISTSAKLA